MALVQVIDIATGEVVAEYPVPPTEVITLEPGQQVVLTDVNYGDPANPDVVIEIIDDRHVQIILADGTPLLIENLYALLEEGEDVGLVFADSGQAYGTGAQAVEVPSFVSLDAFITAAAGPAAGGPDASTGTSGRGADGSIDPPDLNVPHIRAAGVEGEIPRPAFAAEAEIQPDIPEEEAALPNIPPEADDVLTPANSGEPPLALAEALAEAGLDGGADIAFFKKLDITGEIGDPDIVDPDLGGANNETPLASLVFTLTSDPNYGTLILDPGDGSPATILNVGDTFTSADTVWWVATESQVAEFLEANELEVLPDATFTYSVTDAAGDTADATVLITVGDEPSIGTPEAALVDDEALGGIPGGTGDEVQSPDPDSNEATFSGSLDYDFGGDGPGDVTFASLHGVLVKDTGDVTVQSGGVDLRYSWDGTTHTLTAFKDGTEDSVFTLQVTNVSTGAYTLTLLQPLDHPTAGTEDNILLSLPFTVTDADGDTANGKLSVSIDDDVPTVSVLPAVPDASPATDTVAEDGSNLVGSWTHEGGADGVASIKVLVDADGNGVAEEHNLDTNITVHNLGGDELGVLRVNGDGSWTFDPSLDVDNDDAFADDFDFTVRVTDNDGDVASDTHTVSVTDGEGPAGGDSTTLEVDEAQIPDSDNDPVLSFTAGSDDLVSFAFGTDMTAISANTDGIAGNEIFWFRASDTQIEGYINGNNNTGDLAVTLTLSASTIAAGTSGDVTVEATLSDALKHVAGSGTNTFSITGVTVVASDQDGDSATGTVTVNVIDDVPRQLLPDDAVLINDFGGDDVSVSEPLNFLAGADGVGSLKFINGFEGQLATNKSGNPLTSNGVAIHVFGFGTDTLTGQANAVVLGNVELAANTKLSQLGFASGDQVSITAGGDTTTFTMPGTGNPTVNTLITFFNDNNVAVLVELTSEGFLRIEAIDGGALEVGDGGQGSNLDDLGLTADTTEPRDVFTVTLDGGTGEYTFTLLDFVDNGEAITFESLRGTGPAGNPPWKVIEDVDTGQELLVTPINAGSINSDADDIGVSGGQTIGDGEGVRIDIGSIDMFRGGNPWEPGDANNPDDFDLVSHDLTTSFKFDIHGVVGAGSGNTATVFVQVLDADDDEVTTGDPDDVVVPLTAAMILVTDVVGNPLTAGTDYNIFVHSGADGVGVVLVGLQQGWFVQVMTDTRFDAIEIEDARSMTDGDGDPYGGVDSANFSIGGLSLPFVGEGEEIILNFEIEGSDGDGDTITGDLDVVLAPDTDDTQIGTDGAETLTGQPNGDFLYGLDGADTLIGNAGDDLLDGGKGSDILWGDDTAQVATPGADTFRWASVNDLDSDFDGSVNHVDTVKDYSGSGGDGDVLDISDLLTELDVTTAADVPSVFKSIENGGNVELQVKLGSDFETFAIIETTVLAEIIVDDGGLV